MPDSHLGPRWRHMARILRGEQQLTTAARTALAKILNYTGTALHAADFDLATLSPDASGWRSAVEADILPVVQQQFDLAFAATAAGVVDPAPYATRHLEAVWSRLQGVPDEVFDTMRHELELGRAAGESIPQLATRVDALLTDGERWNGRAVMIARTEVIGANNAGGYSAARATSQVLNTDESQVVKEWLATSDGRTRETHADADGQQVLGLEAPFIVGGEGLQYAGDPSGSAAEVVNCVIGSVQVAWPGQLIHATTRRELTGKFVRLVTARGHDLTVTPNHPILTERGYVPAESIRHGEYLIATGLPPAPEIEDGPPSIEQVHRAAQEAGTARRVRGSRVDFHGDGTEAEVEVVRPDRDLLLEGDAARIREGLESVLVRLDRGAGTLPRSRRAERRDRARARRDGRSNSRAAGLVGSRSASTAHLWGQTGGGQTVGLADRPDLQPESLEAAYDQRAADAEVARHLEHALALGMTPCEVIQVEHYEGTHDVFNLQTSDAWYVGNGVAQHNCRCTVLYHYPGDPGYPTDGGALAAAATPQEDDMAVDDDKRTGVVLVALPADSDAVQDIGPEDKHATLIYFGNLDPEDDSYNAGLTDEARVLIEQAAASVAAGEVPAGVESVEAVEALGDEGAQVWMLGGDFLPGLRQDVLDADPALGPLMEAVEQFPDYTPHVTIGYSDEGLTEDDTTAAAAVESITFDRLALWWAGDQTEWPLAAGEQEPEEAPVETETDTVTAAAGDPAPTPPAQTLDAGEPAPELQPDAGIGMEGPEDDDRFYGVMVVEDRQTGDGRVFADQAIEWESTPLPFPLGWQVADAMGHDGSVVCGRFDTVTRFGNLIAYTGTWDLGGAGYETRRLVEGQFLTGLSVDTDDFDAIVVDEDGNPLDPMAMMFEGDQADPILLVRRARIRSAALCRVPAFVEAFIANGEPPAGWAGERPGAVSEGEQPEEDVEVTEEVIVEELVASAVRAGNPPADVPALADYTHPGTDGPVPITVTDDRRIYGYVAAWGTCHIGFDGTCVTPPHSLTGYAHFLKGEVETDGGIVPTGRITMATGHADTQLAAGAASAHYDNTGTAVANVTCGEDEHGIWFSGRLTDSCTPVQIAELRAAGAVSGDWRRIGGNLELVATLAVNVPGFPLPRIGLAASGERQMSLVASGVVTPENATGDRGAPFSMDEVARAAVAIIDRRTRAHAAQARLRSHRETAARQALLRLSQDRKHRVAAAAARLGREND